MSFRITKGHFTLSCNDYDSVEEMYYMSFTRGLPSERFVQLMIKFHKMQCWIFLNDAKLLKSQIYLYATMFRKSTGDSFQSSRI